MKETRKHPYRAAKVTFFTSSDLPALRRFRAAIDDRGALTLGEQFEKDPGSTRGTQLGFEHGEDFGVSSESA